MKNMNFKTITYVAAAVMAASCGNSSNKTAEQVATANEPRLVNVKVMTAETKDVPQSDVYSSIVEAYAKNNIAPQSPSRIQKIYVEVYGGRFYGSLKQQVNRQLEDGKHVIFDVDVVGAQKIKEYYGDRALSVFIQPPSIESLRQRLEQRATDAPEVIEDRLARARFELSQAEKFDQIVVNDDLETAKKDFVALISEFLDKQ